MELLINKKEINFKDIKPIQLYEILCNSTYKNTDIGKSFEQSIFYLGYYLGKNETIPNSYSITKSRCLRNDIERSRRIQKRILNYIPGKIEQINTEMETLMKQSFRLNKTQLKRTELDISGRLKKYKRELKEYKLELKIKKYYIYRFYSSMIPSIYIIKRPSYGIIQCKWKFLGNIQKQIHVGTYKKVGNLSDTDLKEIAIKKINEKYSGTFTSLTLKGIEKEKNKLNKWCSDMNYRVIKNKI